MPPRLAKRLLRTGVILAVLALAAARAEEAATPRAPAPARPADLQAPTEPVAKAAFAVIEKHCSRCHQAGMLTAREKPAKNFGNILRLDEIAADPHLIQPGNPEGSKIFQQISNKEMPYDLYYEFDTTKPEVTEADVDALRAWIASTGDAEAKACIGRRFIAPADIVEAIALDLEVQPARRVAGMRYLTLANLYNSCASDAAMAVYRQGAVKLLNSLSRRSDVVTVITVDPAQTVIAFNLADLGWEPADWNTVLSRYPYAMRPQVPAYGRIANATGSVLPYVRADWFAFSASQPPLYDALLRLPDTFQGLARGVGVDIDSNIRNVVAQRAGFQKSGVSQNNRLIERHPAASGYFWTSYDFAGSKDVQSLFMHPLGPRGPGAFRHDGAETIFSLPNGFQGYYLSRADGTRLDKGPTQIVRDPSRRDLAVTNGISCMGCHDQGMRKAKDEVRDAVFADLSFKKPVRDEVALLYPETAQMNAVIDDDFQRFAAAMKRAGLDPALKLNGVEPINALHRRYEDDLSLRRAAAEYGFEVDRFRQVFVEAGPEALAFMRRLEQGIVPRDQFEGLFGRFADAMEAEKPIDTAGLDGAVSLAGGPDRPASGGSFDLQLTADQSSYHQGEAATFTLIASRDCGLVVVNVTKDGTGTVIFPNRFQSDNAVKAGQVVVLGGPGSPFKFRLPDKGREKVVAICQVDGPAREALGTSIDPKGEAFAEIRNFDRAMSRSIAVEASEARAEAVALHADEKEAAQRARIASGRAAASTAIIIEVE